MACTVRADRVLTDEEHWQAEQQRARRRLEEAWITVGMSDADRDVVLETGSLSADLGDRQW